MADTAEKKMEIQTGGAREFSLEERIRLRDQINKAKLLLISLRRQSEALAARKERLSVELAALQLYNGPSCEVPAILVKAQLRLQQLRDEEERLNRQLDQTTLMPERQESTEEKSIRAEIKQLRSYHEREMQASFAELSQLKEEAEILRMLLSHYQSDTTGAGDAD